MNAFRMTPDRSLDRDYLRTCAIYRLIKTGRINKTRAKEIARLPVNGMRLKPDRIDATIDLWKFPPLSWTV